MLNRCQRAWLAAALTASSCGSPPPPPPHASIDSAESAPKSASSRRDASAPAPTPEELRQRIERQLKNQEATAGDAPIADALPLLAAVPCDVGFCVRAVDDSLDPFREVDPATLPAGVRLERENAPAGARGHLPRRYLAFRDNRGRRAEMEAELAKRLANMLPSDHTLVFGLGLGGDVRSYLAGPGILSSSHLAQATAEKNTLDQGYRVVLKLTEEGKQRFAAATEAMVGRRIVIIIEGEAKSAPVVASRIEGGMASISVSDKRTAEALARTLTP